MFALGGVIFALGGVIFALGGVIFALGGVIFARGGVVCALWGVIFVLGAGVVSLGGDVVLLWISVVWFWRMLFLNQHLFQNLNPRDDGTDLREGDIQSCPKEEHKPSHQQEGFPQTEAMVVCASRRQSQYGCRFQKHPCHG